jgi:putative heme-binding domain-containing protein
LSLLDDPAFSLKVIELAGQLNHPDVANLLISRFDRFNEEEQAAAVNALTKRESLAVPLLDAIKSNQISRNHLTAFQARGLSLLNSKAVDQRLESIWGRVQETPAELQAKIEHLDSFYSQAPLWAFQTSVGRSHFKTLCASCHLPNDTGISFGPDLRGAGANGVRYFLENIIDPNAVVGADYELNIVETKSGQVVSGMIQSQTDSALTLRTLTGEVTLARPDIKSFTKLPQSMMPPGLLDTLSETQQVELLKYLESL